MTCNVKFRRRVVVVRSIEATFPSVDSINQHCDVIPCTATAPYYGLLCINLRNHRNAPIGLINILDAADNDIPASNTPSRKWSNFRRGRAVRFCPSLRSASWLLTRRRSVSFELNVSFGYKSQNLHCAR